MGSFSAKEDARRGRLECRAAAFGWYPIAVNVCDATEDASRRNRGGGRNTPSALLRHLRSDSGAQLTKSLIPFSSLATNTSSSESGSTLLQSSSSGANDDVRRSISVDVSYARLLRHYASTPTTTTIATQSSRSWWGRRKGSNNDDSATQHFPASLTFPWRPVECLIAASDMDVIAMLVVSDDDDEFHNAARHGGRGVSNNGDTSFIRTYGVMLEDPQQQQHVFAIPDRIYNVIIDNRSARKITDDMSGRGPQAPSSTTSPQHLHRSTCKGLSLCGHREVGPVHLARLLRGGDSLVIPPHVLYRNLHVLDLSGTSIGDDGAMILATMLFTTTPHVSRYRSTTAQTSATTSPPEVSATLLNHNTSIKEKLALEYPIKELILVDCGITDKGCAALLSAMLCCLDATHAASDLDDDDDAIVANTSDGCPQPHPLQCEGGGRGASFLLSSLSLANNHITDSSCMLLGQLLAHPYGVEAMDVRGNHFGDDGVVEIAAGLRPRLSLAGQLGQVAATACSQSHHTAPSTGGGASSPVEVIARLRRTVSGVPLQAAAPCMPSNGSPMRLMGKPPFSPKLHASPPGPDRRAPPAHPPPSRRKESEFRCCGLSLQLSGCSHTAAAMSFLAETLLAAHDERVLGVLAELEALQQRIQAVDYWSHVAPTSARSQHRQQQQQQQRSSSNRASTNHHHPATTLSSMPPVVTELLVSLRRLLCSPYSSMDCYIGCYTHGLRRLCLANAALGDQGVEMLCGALCRISSSAATIAEQLAVVTEHARRTLLEELSTTTTATNLADVAPFLASSSSSSSSSCAVVVPFSSSVVFLEELDLTNTNLTQSACSTLLLTLFSRCGSSSSAQQQQQGDNNCCSNSNDRYFKAVTSQAAHLPIQPLCLGCIQPHLRVLRLGNNCLLGGGGGSLCGDLLSMFTLHACKGWLGAVEWMTATSTDPFALGERGGRGVEPPSLLEFDIRQRRGGQPTLASRSPSTYALDLQSCGIHDDALDRWARHCSPQAMVGNVIKRIVTSSSTPAILRALTSSASMNMTRPQEGQGSAAVASVFSLLSVDLSHNQCQHDAFLRTRNLFDDAKLAPTTTTHHQEIAASPMDGDLSSVAAPLPLLQIVECTVSGNNVVMRGQSGSSCRHHSGGGLPHHPQGSWQYLHEQCPLALLPQSVGLVPTVGGVIGAAPLMSSSPQQQQLKPLSVNDSSVSAFKKKQEAGLSDIHQPQHQSVPYVVGRKPEPMKVVVHHEQQPHRTFSHTPGDHANVDSSYVNGVVMDMTDEGVDALIRASEEVMLRWDV
ncbi:leucine-rich repeat protein, putative [Bodo saltans]|uniref:Leucine-rich repeat protein, putative n=1 Tax=Bodo saltans TaxID=75058 RepID=A0A0S4KIH7_BODSA|nr:leucine-rich repeat protein, putative [Bodo saltans]|eukprot:CUI14767.1 leucine-rich repeat protein, putative [Bodo saltans]